MKMKLIQRTNIESAKEKKKHLQEHKANLSNFIEA